ncbi:MAG: ABC transporter ATP-binding protein [Candidatus Omnitrophica bacterium]|nr:ABC transporter ATP-binding protein [Candidatus Omnitrophota bacterium]
MLLQIKNLKKYYKDHGSVIKAVDGLDLVLRHNENLSVVGESGCGKTTLAKIIMGLVRPDQGQVVFEGSDPFRDKVRRELFHRRVRMVFQDPFGSLDPRFTVRAVLKESLCLEKPMALPEESRRMMKILKAVGLTEDILSRYPHEFSGGERQRISIARALMTAPSLLVLDEAVSSLDVLVQKKILLMLSELQKKMSLTYLFISHNLRAVKKISQKIAVMYQGRIVEYGTVDDIFRHPAHPYTERLLKAAFDYKVAGGPVIISDKAVLKDIGKGHLVL